MRLLAQALFREGDKAAQTIHKRRLLTCTA